MRSCNKKELEFTVFIINKLSDYLKNPVHEIYKILKDSDILDDYIIGCYDVLHVNDNITMNRKWKIKMYKNDH